MKPQLVEWRRQVTLRGVNYVNHLIKGNAVVTIRTEHRTCKIASDQYVGRNHKWVT